MNIYILIATALFATVFVVLVLKGGACERYNRRMQKQEMMKQYLDDLKKEKPRRQP